MDLAAFRTRYPEFNRAPDPLINSVLAEALPHVSAAEFGARRDEAHGLVAADLLWSGVFGSSLRRAEQNGAETKESKYRTAFKEILKQAIPRIVVV
jgi:hypothetical protein